MIRIQLKKIIQSAIEQLAWQEHAAAIAISEPGEGIQADFCSNIALALAGKVSLPPAVVAQKIAEAMPSSLLVQKVEVSKNGYINFVLKDKVLADAAIQIIQQDASVLKPPAPMGKQKVMVEFVSANPTGPLHIGHGRGAALGDSLARIYRYCGYDAQAEYYVNDVGVQMQMLADSVRIRAEEAQGKTSVLPENGYKGEYIRDIAKEMARQNRTDYEKFPREYILDWIRKDLQDFRVNFDHWFSETELHTSGKLQNVLDALRQKGYLQEKDGALWFCPEKKQADASEEMEQDRVLKKSDGRYTYFAADIAYHFNKFERGYTDCLDIWGHDHHGYVPRVDSAMAALGLPKKFLKVLLYQLVSLKRGGKRVAMSTRSGEFVTLKEVLDEVGADACRFFFAMRSPNSQLDFDVDLAKQQSNENPVFYVQYVHARICSIFKEAEKRGLAADPKALTVPANIVLQPEEKELLLKLISFPDVLENALQITSPHLLTTYLMDCATRFHKFYDKHRVLDAPEDQRKFRFILLSATGQIVKLGLSLIGVSAPEKM